MIDWTAALANLEEGCAAVFDVTPLTLQPRKAGITGNHDPQNDTTRAPFDFFGSIELEPPSTKLMRHLSPDPLSRDDIVSYEAVLTANMAGPVVVDAQPGTGWPYRPQRGDFVVAGGKTWKIAAVGQDGSTRPALYLVKA